MNALLPFAAVPFRIPAPADLVLLALNGLFFAPMMLRLAGKLKRRLFAQGPNPDEAPRSAPHAFALVVFHMLGFTLLYAGLPFALFVTGIPDRFPLQHLLAGVLVASAGALFAWSLVVFRSWRLLARLDADHQLCTAGPYRLVRHPIYLATILFGIGDALWIPTPATALGAAIIILGGDLRARAEEKLLLATFGEPYREYMGRVKRLVPGLY